jgi:thiol:disulfide interchange protein DsbD
MGAVTGLVASPCLGPVLLALLAWIAKTGDVLQGFTLLFVFALGMGLLLIAIGTFAGVLAALPKSGGWMVRVKELLGLILFGAGVYYVGLALAAVGVPEKATWLVALGLALAVLGFAVKGGQKGESEEPAAPAASGVKRHLRAGVGVIMVVIGAYLAIVGLSVSGVTPAWLGSSPSGTVSQQEGGVAWSGSYESAVERAQAGNMPVMIDFTADWCVYCKKLDSDVFTDERVVAESDRFVTIKVDADRHKDIVRAHEVLGLPTIVFLDSAGAEAARIESYVSADAFLEKMKRVR